MRSRTAISLVLALLLASSFGEMRAQASCENPLEYLALTEGNLLINAEIDDQIKGQTATAALQATMAAEFRKIREWEEKYSSYTQTAGGFASSLNAASHIYDDALRIVLSVGKITRDIGSHPQGAVATMSMNSIYLETATEMVSCLTLLRDAVAKGGRQNMLTGAERSRILWEIGDKLGLLARRLRRLELCIRYYTMTDVWNSCTAGIVCRDHADAARDARSRWIRAAAAAR